MERLNPISIVYNCKPKEFADGIAMLNRATPTKDTARASTAKAPKPYLGWLLFILMVIMFFGIVVPQKSGKFVASGLLNGLSSTTSISLAVLALGVACWVAGVWLFKMAQRATAAAWNNRLRFIFNEEGISQEGDGRRDFFAWEGFRGFDESSNLIVVRKESKRGYIFPKRLFANEVELEKLRCLLCKKCKEPPVLPSAEEPEIHK